MPTLIAQPLLQRAETDFGVAPAQAFDVGLEACLIEPAKHLIKLLSQHEANDRKWYSLKFHFLSEHATKDLGRLGIRQLAACDLDLCPDELLRALKRERDEGSDIIDGNRLICFIGSDRIGELSLQNSNFDLIYVVILHECSWPEYRRGKL